MICVKLVLPDDKSVQIYHEGGVHSAAGTVADALELHFAGTDPLKRIEIYPDAQRPLGTGPS